MINRKYFAAAVFLILFSVEVPGQERSIYVSERESLRGLRSVGRIYTRFIGFNDEVQRLIPEGRLKTDVELILRRNGIPINPEFGTASIVVSINGDEIKNTSGESLGYVAIIDFALVEPVSLLRDLEEHPHLTVDKDGKQKVKDDYDSLVRFYADVRKTGATTWSKTTSPNKFSDRNNAAQGLRQGVRDMADVFSNNYLAANPITR